MKQLLKSADASSQPSVAEKQSSKKKIVNDFPEGTRLPNGKIVIRGGTVRARVRSTPES
jgi:hypothetical protein